MSYRWGKKQEAELNFPFHKQLNAAEHAEVDVLHAHMLLKVVERHATTQAALDLALYVVFFLPGIAALIYAGYDYAGDSWRIREHSNVTADGPPIYPFKTILPIAGAFLLAQGLVEIVRCIVCIKQGEWPKRGDDVDEVDVEKLKEMVHVKDADIDKLDQFVVQQGSTK